MPSNARTALSTALADVDSQIDHARTFTRGRRGAPPSANGAVRPGRPFTRAGLVLLAAALEGYVESVVIEGGAAFLSEDQLKDVKTAAGRSHGANVHHIHQLFSQLGMPFVLDTITWRNQTDVRGLVTRLAKARNQIAHGSAPKSAQLQQLVTFRSQVAKLADRLDAAVADRVDEINGNRPW